MSTTVTYKDNTLTTVNNNTKTLKTAGKYMEGDVTLVDVTEVYTDGDLLGYGLNTSSRVNVAQAGYATVKDYAGNRINKATTDLAVLEE